MNTPRKARLRIQLALSGEVGDAIAELAERATADGAGRPQRLQTAMRAIAYDCLCAGLEAVQIQRGLRRPRAAGTPAEQTEGVPAGRRRRPRGRAAELRSRRRTEGVRIMPADPAGGLSPAEPRAIVVRFTRVMRNQLTGYRNHDLRRGPQPHYIDGEREHLNRYLMRPPTPEMMIRKAVELHRLLGSGAALYRNAATSISGLVAFGKDAQDDFLAMAGEDRDAAIMAVGKAIEKDTGCHLVGAVIHYDETAPHAHLTLEPRNAESGKPFTKVAHLPRLQTIAAETIQDFAPTIRRGTRRKGEPSPRPLHRSVKLLHKDLPNEIAAMEARRQRLRDENNELEEAKTLLLDEQEQHRQRLEDTMNSAREMQRSLDERGKLLDERAKRLEDGETQLQQHQTRLDEAVQAQRQNLSRTYARLTEFMQIFDVYVQDLLEQGIELPRRPELPNLEDPTEDTIH